MCFSESHLDFNMSRESAITSICLANMIFLTEKNPNHGDSLLMYLSCEHACTRITGLETFLNESLWIEIKVNLLVCFIVHRQQIPFSPTFAHVR